MPVNEQLYRGSLTTIILHLLEAEKSMYGYEITRRVKEISKGELQLTEGALYPALHKLEADGLLQVKIEIVNNRSRKYYSLTRSGKKEKANKAADLTAFLQQMYLLLNLKPST